MKKNTMMKLGIGIAFVLIVILITIGISNHKDQTAQEDVMNTWKTIIEQHQFKKIPDVVTASSLEKNDFTKKSVIKKYKTVFNGIGATQTKMSNMKLVETSKDHYKFTYQLTMHTSIGQIPKLDYSANVIKKDDRYIIEWTPSLLFPHMQSTDKISYTIDRAIRGNIVDRNEQPLAMMAPYYEMGVIPGDLGTGKKRERNLQKIADSFDLTVESIEKKMAQSWVTDALFVPLKIIEQKDVQKIDGVQYGARDLRYYPLGEAAAHLIGYTGKANEEDLKKDKTLHRDDVIGKTGLEKAYDKALRGEDGGQIAIVTQSGRVRDVLLRAERTDGKNIQLTIDSTIQKATFKALEKATGASVVINPKNGDLTALVSKPSFDPNLMVRGISQEQYEKYAENEDLPFLSRFTQRYAPGSTMKTMTAAIGLDNGTTTENKTHRIEGLKWQKDTTWGSYYVTRLHDDVTNVEYKSALIYSDNIFFAKEGLEMGEKKLRAGLSKFAFDKDFNLPLAMKPAQISNDKTFKSDILLADTAYGQGEVLMSPIQQAVSYTAFANDGNMSYPRLVMDAKEESSQAISATTAHKVRAAMQQVIRHDGGTGNILKSLPYNLAAKTGTAELKQKQGVYNGTENSFVLVFNADKENYLLLSVVENHEKTGRTAIELSKSLIPVLEAQKEPRS